MLIEIVAIWSILIVLLFFFAYGSNNIPLGVIGGVLLLVFGYWVTTDGIELQSGFIKSGTENQTITSMNNSSSSNSSVSIAKNETVTISYDGATVPVGDLKSILGSVIILLGLYLTLFWALKGLE